MSVGTTSWTMYSSPFFFFFFFEVRLASCGIASVDANPRGITVACSAEDTTDTKTFWTD